MAALESCQCLACTCPIGTRDATRRCVWCRDGDHPGLPRKQSAGVPIPAHVRRYAEPCDVCGAPIGRRCFRYKDELPKETQDTINAKAPISQSGTGSHSPKKRASP